MYSSMFVAFVVGAVKGHSSQVEYYYVLAPALATAVALTSPTVDDINPALPTIRNIP